MLLKIKLYFFLFVILSNGFSAQNSEEDKKVKNGSIFSKLFSPPFNSIKKNGASISANVGARATRKLAATLSNNLYQNLILNSLLKSFNWPGIDSEQFTYVKTDKGRNVTIFDMKRINTHIEKQKCIDLFPVINFLKMRSDISNISRQRQCTPLIFNAAMILKVFQCTAQGSIFQWAFHRLVTDTLECAKSMGNMFDDLNKRINFKKLHNATNTIHDALFELSLTPPQPVNEYITMLGDMGNEIQEVLSLNKKDESNTIRSYFNNQLLHILNGMRYNLTGAETGFLDDETANSIISIFDTAASYFNIFNGPIQTQLKSEIEKLKEFLSESDKNKNNFSSQIIHYLMPSQIKQIFEKEIKKRIHIIRSVLNRHKMESQNFGKLDNSSMPQPEQNFKNIDAPSKENRAIYEDAICLVETIKNLPEHKESHLSIDGNLFPILKPYKQWLHLVIGYYQLLKNNYNKTTLSSLFPDCFAKAFIEKPLNTALFEIALPYAPTFLDNLNFFSQYYNKHFVSIKNTNLSETIYGVGFKNLKFLELVGNKYLNVVNFEGFPTTTSLFISTYPPYTPPQANKDET